MTDLHMRIEVLSPPAEVTFAMQRGRDELVAPIRITPDALLFAFDVRIGKPLADGRPNLLGAFAQGTPAARFVYVNSGCAPARNISPGAAGPR